MSRVHFPFKHSGHECHVMKLCDPDVEVDLNHPRESWPQNFPINVILIVERNNGEHFNVKGRVRSPIQAVNLDVSSSKWAKPPLPKLHLSWIKAPC